MFAYRLIEYTRYWCCRSGSSICEGKVKKKAISFIKVVDLSGNGYYDNLMATMQKSISNTFYEIEFF